MQSWCCGCMWVCECGGVGVCMCCEHIQHVMVEYPCQIMGKCAYMEVKSYVNSNQLKSSSNVIQDHCNIKMVKMKQTSQHLT